MRYRIHFSSYSLIFPSYCYGITLALVMLLNLAILLQIIFCLLMAVILGYNILQWRRCGREMLTLVHQPDQQWLLERRQGHCIDCQYLQLEWQFILMSRWIVLHFKAKDHHRKVRMILYPGNLSVSQFRQLRVRLQYCR